MWFKTDTAIEQRDAAQRAVRLTQLHNTLATAVIDVQRGQFEPSRQLTSDFYTNLRHQVDTTTALCSPVPNAKDSNRCSANVTS